MQLARVNKRVKRPEMDQAPRIKVRNRAVNRLGAQRVLPQLALLATVLARQQVRKLACQVRAVNPAVRVETALRAI